MKPTFHHRLVNGPFEDPTLYVRLLWQRRALLFDVGDLSALNRGSIVKVSDVFVTHTHIDHFIGFDTVLRAQLRTERPLRVYGPPDIIDHVEGKLGGYSWNIIEEYPLRIEVFGVGADSVRHASFYASESFRRTDREEKPFDGTVLDEGNFKVRAALLRHDIPCLGFTLEEDFHINIDKDALARRGLPVGHWLAELKGLIRDGSPDSAELAVDHGTFALGELRDLAMITKGQKIAYVMDAEPEEENVQKIKHLVKDTDTLYCEAYFVEADADRARERNHLTAALAGRIAREAGVRELVLAHFSPKYRGHGETPEEEALEEFRRRP